MSCNGNIMKNAIGVMAVAALLGWARPAGAVTRYHIIRVATCATFTSQDPSAHARLDPGTDELRASNAQTIDGYCSFKLPQLSRLQWATAYGLDDSVNEMRFELQRSDYCCENVDCSLSFPDGRPLAEWSSVNNAGVSCGGWTGNVIRDPLVLNNGFSYWVHFRIPFDDDPAKLRLWTIEIAYQ